MIRLFNQYFSKRKILFFAGECGFIILAVILTLFIQGNSANYLYHPFLLTVKIVTVIIVYQVSLFFSDFYSTGLSWGYRKLIYRLITSLIIAFLLLTFFHSFINSTLFEKQTLIIIFLLLLSFLLPWRLYYSWSIKKGNHKQRTLILGAGKLAKDIGRAIIKDQELSLRLEGFVAIDPQLKGVSIVNPTVVGTMDELPAIIRERNINKIIVAMEERRGTVPLDKLLQYKSEGISIEDGVNFYERITNQLLVEYINPSYLIFCDGFKLSYTSMFLKRVCDIAFSFIGLIIASPLLVILGLLIKLESPGPVVYKQKRVGRSEKTFNIYKLRSMQHDAEKQTGPIMTSGNDGRITRIGKIIRKTRLDELPQLWNVFTGCMSFVGPRPERPVFVEKFKKHIPFYTQRFSLRPGITGWAQIRYPYASTIEQTLDKLRYELYYMKNFSLLFDLTIILRTIKVVLFAKGS